MEFPDNVKIRNDALPDTPGVYFMKNAAGDILYVGKAGNLRRRVASYFARPHDSRIEKLVREIRAIDYRKTDTAIEALILEAELIKEFMPPYNVREKDGTSFLYVEITKEPFPRVHLVRGKDPMRGRRFGPFTSASSAREAYRIVRRIFPFSTHLTEDVHITRNLDGSLKYRPCLDYQIGLCPGTCTGAISKAEYCRTIRRITLFFEGKKKQVLRTLEKEMRAASKVLQFERAERARRQIFALQHIQDVAVIADRELAVERPGARRHRIEGYDVSNISGTSAVGSMVVFVNGAPDKNEYRKFRIKTVEGANDVAMLREVLTRRFRNNWPLPDIMLVDGGAPQVNAARRVLRRFRVAVPVVGLAKGPERKRNDVVGRMPAGVDLATLIKVRDEAHRFAISYHRKLRAARSIGG